MKGVDEFIWVFVVAVVVLIIFAAWGLWAGAPPDAGGGVVPGAGNFTLLGEFSLGRVGYTGTSPIRTESMGSFIAGEPQSEALKSVTELSIATSLIGMESREYTIPVQEEVLSEVRKVDIVFTVDDTNLYGNLRIKWNGKEVLNRQAYRGYYTVEIEKDNVKTVNSLEVYADGPGWLFWAATTYDLKDFKVNQVSGASKIYPFSLTLSELQTFDHAEVRFSVSKRAGDTLLIKANGITVYNAYPGVQENVSFEYGDFLKAGKNLLVFSAETGSFNIEDAELSVYSLTNVLVKSRGFDLSSEMLGDFQLGVLEVTVDNVVKEGDLSVKVNGNAVDTAGAAVGKNRFTFGKSLVKEGDNDIEFSGSGAFDVSQVRIGFEG